MKAIQLDSLEDRSTVWPDRAEAFGKSLEGRYLDRNWKLFRHPFAQSSIKTWSWVLPTGESGASLDLVRIQTCEGKFVDLIASFVVPLKFRGCGYARALLRECVRNRDGEMVLFSDIDPKFYERFGFTSMPMTKITETPSPRCESPPEFSPCSFEDFANHFTRQRLEQQAAAANDLGFLDLNYLRWHEARWRWYEETLHWQQPSFFWTDSQTGISCVIWRERDRLQVGWVGSIELSLSVRFRAFLSARCRELGLSAWEQSVPAVQVSGERLWPMWLPTSPGGVVRTWSDVQAVDAW